MVKAPLSKAERIAKAKRELQQTLNRVGYQKRKRVLTPLKLEQAKTVGGSIPENGTKREAAKYSGTEIIGISQMHKSNAVPISNKKEAQEHARMRRG
jgi:hypothetical protein